MLKTPVRYRSLSCQVSNRIEILSLLVEEPNLAIRVYSKGY